MSRERAHVREVGARDGFQNVKRFIPTEAKVELIDRLSETGLPVIEATSFVSPRMVPQLADGDEVAARIRRRPGVTYLAFIATRDGLERAVRARLDGVTLVVSGSESASQRNFKRSIHESRVYVCQLIEEARVRGLAVSAGVGTAFGCPIEGDVPHERVLESCRALVAAGAQEIFLGDSTGVANPVRVRQLFGRLAEEIDPGRLVGHFHDTRGTGLANVYAALEAGVRRFDASFGGVGGCPFIPGASGNVATEDVVSMLEEMGYDTGVVLDRLLAAGRRLGEVLGEPLPSHLLVAGPVNHGTRVPA